MLKSKKIAGVLGQEKPLQVVSEKVKLLIFSC